MRDAPTRPVLRYHGGKWKLAPWIIRHFPAHRAYVEPFGGAASELLQKPRAYAEVYNDKWGDVVALFRVLRDKDTADELCRRLHLTPFARAEFEPIDQAAFDRVQDPIERARILIFRSFAGFGSNAHSLGRKTGFRGTCDRAGTTPAHDWANLPAALGAVVDRLRGVVIENRDAMAVMRRHDRADTLHYVDPPYPHSTRRQTNPYDLKYGGYAFEMTDAQHRGLGSGLRDLRGMVVLSGYRCALYDRLFSDWRRVETETHADGARKRTECLWLNPACATAIGHGPLFDREAAA